jgi:hypothetical protein
MSTNGTSNRSTAHPDHPKSCSLETPALSIVTEQTITISPSGRWSGVPTRFPSVDPLIKATIINTIEPMATGAPNQKRNSSLPIRLEIINASKFLLCKKVATPAYRFLVFWLNWSSVQVHPTRQLPILAPKILGAKIVVGIKKPAQMLRYHILHLLLRLLPL